MIRGPRYIIEISWIDILRYRNTSPLASQKLIAIEQKDSNKREIKPRISPSHSVILGTNVFTPPTLTLGRTTQSQVLNLISAHHIPSSKMKVFLQPPGRWWKPVETTRTESETSFWSGKILSPRPQSIKSASSSNNCSLRGSQVVDPEEQNMSLLKEISPTSSMDHGCMSTTLVPPPVKLGEGVSITCDICGQILTAARRLDWQ